MSSIVGTLLSIGLAVVIWRKYVRWTVLRSTSTLGLVTLVVAHVILWRPLWAIGGCGVDEYLRTAQSLAFLGLTLAAFYVCWWGACWKKSAGQRTSADGARRFVMTPNAVRLLIGIAQIPFLTGVFWICAFALHDFVMPNSSTENVFAVCYEVCAILAVVLGVLVWRQTVEWNRWRRGVTLLLAFIFLVSPGAVYGMPVFSSWANTESWQMLCWLMPVFAWALWLAGTAWTWRSAQSRGSTELAGSVAIEALVRCPACDYSLRGLHEVRCPECGWTSTVDDVVTRSLDRVLATP